VGTQRLDFADFYRRSKDECLLTVLVSVGDRDTAQDLVAEAFARAWASWHTVSEHPAPTAWVVRTALNVNISRWRRRRREISVPDPSVVADPPAADDAADGTVNPTIMTALLRLPARQRQVVALRFILDLDTGRTADVLGIAPGTVQAHLARAMAALRNDLIPTTHIPATHIPATHIPATHIPATQISITQMESSA
jgi:RNA polymerase sigma-70 factor (ECF subfamily)